MSEDKDFDSIEEANEYLKKFVDKSEIPAVKNKSALRRAQDIIYDAWGFVDPAVRVDMAEEAPEISKDCADAYVILAEDAASSWEEAKEYYMEGIKAGERALGKKNFEEYRGYFRGFTEALLAYVKEGSSQRANKLLFVAIKYNKHVPDYLLGRKIPSEKLPDRITLGGDDEDMCYGAVFLKAWQKVPGAIEWLNNQTKDKKAGRNDPCPCGSGKKYKYCCGIN
ncbi:MAG: SEC-C metal-binding domain-containing protein [Elusimicrobiota bacterium]